MDFGAGMLVGVFLGSAGALVFLALVSSIPNEYPPLNPSRVFRRRIGTVLILVSVLLAGYLFQLLEMRLAAFAILILLLLVFVAARVRDLVTAWLTLVLAAAVLSYVLPPAGSLKVDSPEDQLLLVVFVLCGAVGSRLMQPKREIH